MSLKVFHLIFIVLSIVLSIICAVWSFANQVAPAFGAGAVIAAVALLVYGVFFVKKARKIIT